MNDQILNVAVHGALGKMGRYVLETVSSSNDMKLCFGVDKKSETFLLFQNKIFIKKPQPKDLAKLDLGKNKCKFKAA